MKLSTITTLGLGALLLLQVLTAFTAIALLARISPAVDGILRDNVYSDEATEELLAVLAREPVVSPAGRTMFDAALGRALGNITEPAEEPLLKTVADNRDLVLGGDPAGRAAVADALRSVGAVNRASMKRADEQARLFGLAGGWTVAALGLAASALGVLVYRRIRRRLVEPVLEIDATLMAVRAGDPFRRCAPLWGALETGRIAGNLNEVLDARMRSREERCEKSALALLIERLVGPAFVVDPDGAVVATNGAADTRFETLGDSPVAMAAQAASGPIAGWHRTPLAGGGWLVELD